jgi:hypothetical protein
MPLLCDELCRQRRGFPRRPSLIAANGGASGGFRSHAIRLDARSAQRLPGVVRARLDGATAPRAVAAEARDRREPARSSPIISPLPSHLLPKPNTKDPEPALETVSERSINGV